MLVKSRLTHNNTVTKCTHSKEALCDTVTIIYNYLSHDTSFLYIKQLVMQMRVGNFSPEKRK